MFAPVVRNPASCLCICSAFAHDSLNLYHVSSPESTHRQLRFNPAHTKRDNSLEQSPARHHSIRLSKWCMMCDRAGRCAEGGMSACLSCRCHGDAWSEIRHSGATVREPDGRHEVRRLAFVSLSLPSKCGEATNAASTLLYIHTVIYYFYYKVMCG